MNGDALSIIKLVDGIPSSGVIDVTEHIIEKYGHITLGQLLQEADELIKPRRELKNKLSKEILGFEIFSKKAAKLWKLTSHELRKKFYDAVEAEPLLSRDTRPFACTPQALLRFGFSETTTVKEMFENNGSPYNSESNFRYSFRKRNMYSRKLLGTLYFLYKDELLRACLLCDPYGSGLSLD